jgi:hypothetical protein
VKNRIGFYFKIDAVRQAKRDLWDRLFLLLPRKMGNQKLDPKDPAKILSKK